MRTKWLWTGLALLIIIAIPVAWWLIAPLFLDTAVDEAFPFDLPPVAEITTMPAEEKRVLLDEVMVQINEPTVVEGMDETALAEVEERVQALAVAMPTKAMDDAMPTPAADEWLVLASGSFQGADDFHQGSGRATLFQQGDARVLRFEEFSVTNGPDLHVLLVENSAATSSADMGAYVDLGALKGNLGNQNYTIPASVDLAQYGGVMIYCQPFHVVFATAPLARE